jgi:hypothetical protein
LVQVAADLTTAQREAVRAQGLGQWGAGPGAVLAEQVGQMAEDAVAASGVRLRAGLGGEQDGPAVLPPAVEDLADGLGVVVEVGSEAGCRPASLGEEEHLQAVADGGGQRRAAQGLEFGTAGVVELNVDHVTLYATLSRCLGLPNGCSTKKR